MPVTKNEVTKLSAQTPRLYGEKPALGTVDPCTIIQEGEAIGTFYGFKWAGLQKNDKGQWVDTYYKSNGTITTDLMQVPTVSSSVTQIQTSHSVGTIP